MKAEKRKMRLADPIVLEIEQEGEITRRLLEIIPEDKLSWRPHPKARSLGELAMHVATTQGGVAEISQLDTKEAGTFPIDPEPISRSQILDAFARSLEKAKDIIASTDDERALAEWRLVKDGATLLAVPRVGFWRSILLNHYYHHRGQLSVYLRQLDVPLPSIYGPSADTNPFA
jgi:uncharacterized damage-inducible protein DinB